MKKLFVITMLMFSIQMFGQTNLRDPREVYHTQCIKYNDDRSLTIKTGIINSNCTGLINIRIEESQIPALIKIFEAADKLTDYADNNEVNTTVSREIGRLNGLVFYFEMNEYGSRGIKFNTDDRIRLMVREFKYVDVITTWRNDYYKELAAYNAMITKSKNKTNSDIDAILGKK